MRSIHLIEQKQFLKTITYYLAAYVNIPQYRILLYVFPPSLSSQLSRKQVKLSSYICYVFTVTVLG